MENIKLSDIEFREKYEGLPTIENHVMNVIFSIVYFFFAILTLVMCGILVALFIMAAGNCIKFAISKDLASIFFFCFAILCGWIGLKAGPVLGKIVKELFEAIGFLLFDYHNKKKEFLKECGMDEDTAYKHYKFIKEKAIYMPWIQKICKMNPSAKYNQIILIKKWYEMDHSAVDDYVFEREFSTKDYEFDTKELLSKDISERKNFIDRLFKLAIVQDGIHNDEWNFLMKTMEELNFNKNYFALFQRRYGPLRTEFEDERKDSTSTGERTVAYLNPYYAILGLDNSATEEEIKKAYHALALEHHPDLPKNANRIQECEEMMAKINEAYEKIGG